MPAIRIVFNGTLALATTPPENSHWVEIRMHNKNVKRFEWLGLICKHGVNLLPDGAYAKMIAKEVTNGDGKSFGEWRRLREDEFVLAWRVQHKANGNLAWGIYGIIGADGWPIVMTDKNYLPPTQPTAELYHIEGARDKLKRASTQSNGSKRA